MIESLARRRRRAAPPALLLALALVPLACGGGEEPEGYEIVELSTDLAESASPAEPAPAATVEPPELDTSEAAVATLAEYYQAIAAGQYARAYSLWRGGGEASGQSFEEFRAGFADTERVSIEIGAAGRVEGAAGSRYVEIPVTLSATLADGTAQCFRGTYALRRSVVPGATADERLWRLHSADLAPCDPAAVDGAPPGDGGAGDEAPAAAPPAVVALVTRLGERLDQVSLLAPPETLAQQIRAEYGPLVTPDLLARWLAAPTEAPGRQTSSPSPDRIEVLEVTPEGDGYTVRGEVVSLTSVERAEGGAAQREPVEIAVVPDGAGGWRIAGYQRR
ncbi:MAG TPA: hypothetical protein VHM02_00400 [Thermoanaerobaculia bacterium]|nr:hypothetical protein [Thermoanaerobaculia bacterium]